MLHKIILIKYTSIPQFHDSKNIDVKFCLPKKQPVTRLFGLGRKKTQFAPHFCVLYRKQQVFSFFCKKIAISKSPDILLSDPWFLVLNKPAGLNAEPDAQGNPNAVNWVEEQLRGSKPLPANFFPGLPHRLDRPTSGLLIVTLRKQALVRIGRQFEDRQLLKTYYALVEGNVEEAGQITHWHRKNTELKRAELKEKFAQGWTQVSLNYSIVRRYNQATLLELQPATGKYHQIRAQLSAIGHPIVNDQLYGARKVAAGAEIALHAGKLTFQHPKTEAMIQLEAPIPVTGVWSLM